MRRYIEKRISEYNKKEKEWERISSELKETRIMAFEPDKFEIWEFEQLDKHYTERFHERLIRFIDERNLNDTDVYKKAGISRQTFSKIRSGQVKPKKKTVFLLCLAMKLDMDNAEDLLRSAGYALTGNNILDLAFEYFTKRHMYDIDQDEYMLFKAFGESFKSGE